MAKMKQQVIEELGLPGAQGQVPKPHITLLTVQRRLDVRARDPDRD